MTALPTDAFAEDATAECLSAHEGAQLSRSAGDLLSAKTQLLGCLRPECPAIVQKDCGGWLEEVERDLPTVVVSVRQDDQDRDDAELSIDGRATPLGGREIPLNPGRHVFRVALATGEVKEQGILIAVGERGRRVAFEWTTPPPPSPKVSPEGATSAGTEKGPRTTRPIPTTVWIALGVGGVGIVTGGVLGTLGIAEKDSLTCAPFCGGSAKASVDDKFLAADVAFGVGALGLLAAGTLYLLRPEVPENSASWSIEVTAVPGGGSVHWGRSF